MLSASSGRSGGCTARNCCGRIGRTSLEQFSKAFLFRRVRDFFCERSLFMNTLYINSKMNCCFLLFVVCYCCFRTSCSIALMEWGKLTYPKSKHSKCCSISHFDPNRYLILPRQPRSIPCALLIAYSLLKHFYGPNPQLTL